MSEKIVSQLDEAGYFVGPSSAQESPLEPGVFLIPGGATDVPPPDIPEGMRARWDGTWIFEEIPVPEVPTASVPMAVTRFQARMALRNAGLFDQAVALMGQPETPVAVVEAWDSAQEFRRDSVNVKNMATALGLSESQLDDLFVAASGIQA